MSDQRVENMIIIGGGPAGHTAGIYAGRAMLEPLMFEWFMAGGVAAGGQLTTTTDVENRPGEPDGIQGPELMVKMRQHSLNSGVRVETKTVDSVDLSQRPFTVQVGKDMHKAKTLVIATGATAKKLKAPGVDQYRNRGISGCAVCDGALPIFRNKELGIVGGGDVAMEEALHLTKYASKVHIFVRSDTLKASKILQDRARNHEKIEFHRFTEVQEVLGNEKLITGVKIINNQTQKTGEMHLGGLFFAIGHTPNTGFLGGQVDTDDTGYIITKPGTTQTSVPGVHAVGDVQDKIYRQAITSAGTGCMAALSLVHRLEENA